MVAYQLTSFIGRLYERLYYWISRWIFRIPIVEDTGGAGDPPIIFVEGVQVPSLLIALGIKEWWTPRWMLKSKRRVFYPLLPPYADEHTRALYLYHYIKGGRPQLEDGATGRGYEGVYKQWSKDNPVHFVSHSLGTRTICALETLLRKDPSPPAILSMTFANAIFTGVNAVKKNTDENGARNTLTSKISIYAMNTLLYISKQFPWTTQWFDSFPDAHPPECSDRLFMNVKTFNKVWWNSSVIKTASTNQTYSANPNIRYLAIFTDATTEIAGINFLTYSTFAFFDYFFSSRNDYTDGFTNLQSQTQIWNDTHGLVVDIPTLVKGNIQSQRGHAIIALHSGGHMDIPMSLGKMNVADSVNVIRGITRFINEA